MPGLEKSPSKPRRKGEEGRLLLRGGPGERPWRRLARSKLARSSLVKVCPLSVYRSPRLQPGFARSVAAAEGCASRRSRESTPE